MKLLRFGEVGFERPGLLDAEGSIRDLSGVVCDIAGEVITPQGLERLAELDVTALPLVGEPVRLGSCVARPGKFICIGLNYADHAAEGNLPVPPEPILFMKATSAVCGPDDNIIIPKGSEKTDWEVELGVVIGKPGLHIQEADALSHIAGYCVVHDLSERAFQNEREGQWVKGKSCDNFGPIGPWLVTRDEVPDPQALHLWLDVDDRRRQDSSTAQMIYPVTHLVSYISQFMRLESGDIISTGTPPGVGIGQKPPVFLRAGQRVRLGIAGLGEQAQNVVPYASAAA